MAANDQSASREIRDEIDPSGVKDYYILEHSEFSDPRIELLSPEGEFTIEALRGGVVVGSAVPSANGYAELQLNGRRGPTADPSRHGGPSCGFRVTNTGGSRTAFNGSMTWSYGRTV